MGRKLPTFSALRAFEAFARRGTLAETAEELCITSSAVSQQIKALEIYLGAKLFVRRNTGLEITDEGKAYLLGISQALDRIEAETAHFLKLNHDRGIVINIYQTLAQFWLTPILPRFMAMHPGTAIRLITAPDEVDLAGSDVDIAIRHLPLGQRPANAVLLCEEISRPVASPGYLARHDRVDTVEILARQQLIECTWFDAEWANWFEKMGKGPQITNSHFHCDTRSQALAAAAEGIGVALDLHPNGERMITSGALVALDIFALPTGSGYYLIVPERSAALPNVRSFRKWLLEETLALRPPGRAVKSTLTAPARRAGADD